MREIKNDPIFAYGNYDVLKPSVKDVVLLKYENDEKKLYGIFNVGLKEGRIEINDVNGKFTNLIDNETVVVDKGYLELSKKPVVIEVRK